MEEFYSKIFAEVVSKMREIYDIDSIKPHDYRYSATHIAPGLLFGIKEVWVETDQGEEEMRVGPQYIIVNRYVGKHLIRIINTFPLRISLEIIDLKNENNSWFDYDTGFVITEPKRRYEIMKQFYYKCLELISDHQFYLQFIEKLECDSQLNGTDIQ